MNSIETSVYKGEPYKCEKCQNWYYRSNTSCLVEHFGKCCHAYEEEYHGPNPDYDVDEEHSIEYKFNEDESLNELRQYIAKTYQQHYSQSKIQTTEFVIDNGHGEGFCVGNAIKYMQRYGKKNGHQRSDILKALHYLIILLHTHDLEHSDEAKS